MSRSKSTHKRKQNSTNNHKTKRSKIEDNDDILSFLKIENDGSYQAIGHDIFSSLIQQSPNQENLIQQLQTRQKYHHRWGNDLLNKDMIRQIISFLDDCPNNEIVPLFQLNTYWNRLFRMYPTLWNKHVKYYNSIECDDGITERPNIPKTSTIFLLQTLYIAIDINDITNTNSISIIREYLEQFKHVNTLDITFYNNANELTMDEQQFIYTHILKLYDLFVNKMNVKTISLGVSFYTITDYIMKLMNVFKPVVNQLLLTNIATYNLLHETMSFHQLHTLNIQLNKNNVILYQQLIQGSSQTLLHLYIAIYVDDFNLESFFNIFKQVFNLKSLSIRYSQHIQSYNMLQYLTNNTQLEKLVFPNSRLLHGLETYYQSKQYVIFPCMKSIKIELETESDIHNLPLFFPKLKQLRLYNKVNDKKMLQCLRLFHLEQLYISEFNQLLYKKRLKIWSETDYRYTTIDLKNHLDVARFFKKI